MKSISRVEHLGDRYIKRHWLLVKKTIEQVFKEDSSGLDVFREELKKFSQFSQLLQYHTSPLVTAAELCGWDRSDVKDEHATTYKKLKLQLLEEEILSFLESRKGPVEQSWLFKILFGTRYDFSEPLEALQNLIAAGKVCKTKDSRLKNNFPEVLIWDPKKYSKDCQYL